MLSKENVSAFGGSHHKLSKNTYLKVEYHASFVDKARGMLKILFLLSAGH